jgi:hypothetical protein
MSSFEIEIVGLWAIERFLRSKVAGEARVYFT